jgi:hypothetical protein
MSEVKAGLRSRPIAHAAMVALSFVAANPGAAWAQTLPTLPSLPPEVRAEIQDSVKQCGGAEKVRLKWGFVVAEDVNADGIDDYVLDYGKFVCGDTPNFFCGSAGCLTQVFASLPDGKYAKVLDENVRDLRFAYDAQGRPVMLLDLHGSACGKVGSAPCFVTLLWNGHRFSEASH